MLDDFPKFVNNFAEIAASNAMRAMLQISEVMPQISGLFVAVENDQVMSARVFFSSPVGKFVSIVPPLSEGDGGKVEVNAPYEHERKKITPLSASFYVFNMLEDNLLEPYCVYPAP